MTEADEQFSSRGLVQIAANEACKYSLIYAQNGNNLFVTALSVGLNQIQKAKPQLEHFFKLRVNFSLLLQSIIKQNLMFTKVEYSVLYV